MSAERFRGGEAALTPPVAASRTEGLAFVAKLAAEFKQGDFERPGTALFGVYGGVYDEICGGALTGVCGLVPDPYLEPDPHAGRLRDRCGRRAAHALELS